MQIQIKSGCRFLLVLFFVLLPSMSQAYTGPGLGLGTIGVVVGVLVSSFLILIGIVWHPLKKLLKWLRRSKDANKKPLDEKST